MQLKIINRKNYIPLVCVLYTCWVLFKLITEEFIWHTKDASYVSNLLWGFVLTALLIGLLKLGEYCSDWPLWLVILLQYGIFLAVVLGSTWVSGHFRELADTAYRDEFRSTTIPFAGPPTLGLHGMEPIIDRCSVYSTVSFPIRAVASAASIPACPPPTTMTSNM